MNLIQKLNSIKADDLKNIDWGGLKDRLLSQPGLLICIAIVFLTIIVSILPIQSQLKKSKALKAEIVQLKEKVGAISKLESTKKEYGEFIKNIPERISENRLIEILSEIALKRGLRIISFSPANKTSNIFVNLTNVGFTITSKNYNDIVRFINDIENLTYSVRIKSWTGASKSSGQQSQRYSRYSRAQGETDQDSLIEAKIEIESMEFKYE